MGFIDDFIYTRRCKKATKQMVEKVGFDLFDEDMYARSYDAKWYTDKPFVIILYMYKNNEMIRREFYEFTGKQWQYIGYMSKKSCLDFYWKIKGPQSYQEWGKNVRNDKDKEQTDHVMELELDEYFRYYRNVTDKRLPPADGAKPLRKSEQDEEVPPLSDEMFEMIMNEMGNMNNNYNRSK